MMLLEAKSLKKSFHRKGSEIPVLRGVDLILNPGEKVAISGTSGAGKSTLLHLLGTLEKPTSGMLAYQGKDLLKLNDEEASVFRNQELGFVFQFHFLLPECTALENVMMPSLIGGKSFSEAEKEAMELLEIVGLHSRISHRPAELSGGEQQRVAIARAVIRKPKLLLADELTGNLDSENREVVFQLLLELQKKTNVAVLLVTHDPSLAKRMDRILVMRDGLLVSG